MTQNAQTKKNEQQFTSISPSKTADADTLVEVITNALLEKK
jgi:hypothetical protein